MTASADVERLILRRAVVLAFEFVALGAILVLAAHLRLANVAENPAWYTDETTHIDIARHLLHGEMRYMAVRETPLLFGRVPLFHVILAAQYRANPTADPILVLRTFTGTLGVFCVMMLYVAVRLSRDRWLALMAALALAIYPQAIVYSRFGFSYNLLTLWFLVAMLGMWRYAATGHAPYLALAALAVGLATVTEIMGFILLAPLVVVVLLIARKPLALLWGLPLSFVPFGIYALMMLARAPESFRYDLAFTIARLGGNPPQPLEGQIANLLHNYTTLMGESLWFPLGIAGLFLVRPARLAAVTLLLFWTPFVSVGKGFALYNLSAYYMIPLLPFLALGAAAVARYGALSVWRIGRDMLRGLPPVVRQPLASALTAVVLLVVVGVPLQPSLAATLWAVDSGFPTPIDGFLINTRDARAVADYVNANSTPQDIAVVSPVVGWLFNTDVSDFQMTAAAAGNTTPHLPGDLPRERWAFPMAYTEARYMVVDNLWYNWGVPHVPGLAEMLRDVETWNLVFQSGELRVYENPEYA